MMNGSLVCLVLVVTALCAIGTVGADQLPVKPKFNLSALLNIRLPIRRLSTTTVTPMTTPSMVDMNWNFTQPGVLAQNCLKGEGDLKTYCQNKATSDWDPARINTTTSTTWETCCALFQELDCYVKNSYVCPPAYQAAVSKYAKSVAYYFHGTICQSVSFEKWQDACTKDAHAAQAKAHDQDLGNNTDVKPQFVQLPKDDGPEGSCFIKLRSHTGTNLEQQCLNSSLNKWDPSRHKFVDSGVQDSCCAIYDSLDCVQREAAKVCTSSEQTDMDNYKRKSVVAFGQTICTTIPYGQAKQLCTLNKGPGGGALTNLPSLLALGASLLLLVFKF